MSVVRNLKLLATAVAALFSIQAAAHAEVQVQVGWDSQLFPSYILSTATAKLPALDSEDGSRGEVLGDPHGLVAITITAPKDNCRYSVTVRCDDLMEPTTINGKLAKKGTTYVVRPKVRYRFEKLAANRQVRPCLVTCQQSVEGSGDEETSVTCTLRSINDCPIVYRNGERAEDVSFTFAAFVNEQHPFVDKILRDALNIGYVNSFTGKQSGDEGEVLRQVYAIWDVLATRDIRYSSITTSAADSSDVISQHVRLIDESINNAQANCVDGSVLLASLLRKVDIEPVLLIVPGHCYVGFYLDEKKERFVAIESTLIGEMIEADVELTSEFDHLVEEGSFDPPTWRSFVAAITMGGNAFDEHRASFEDAAQSDYQMIDIALARQVGILPIAFAGNEQLIGLNVQFNDEPSDPSDASADEYDARAPSDRNRDRGNTGDSRGRNRDDNRADRGRDGRGRDGRGRDGRGRSGTDRSSSDTVYVEETYHEESYVEAELEVEVAVEVEEEEEVDAEEVDEEEEGDDVDDVEEVEDEEEEEEEEGGGDDDDGGDDE
jgi:hypothetical protein